MKDTHVHISLESHAVAVKAAKKAKVSLKDFVSAAIIKAAKQSKK